jgi:hypothetical protein
MKIFNIKKFFRGGVNMYYAIMPKNKKMGWGNWQQQLSDWGERTDGGKCYGYTMRVTTVYRIPKIKRLRRTDRLQFDPSLLKISRFKRSKE